MATINSAKSSNMKQSMQSSSSYKVITNKMDSSSYSMQSSSSKMLSSGGNMAGQDMQSYMVDHYNIESGGMAPIAMSTTVETKESKVDNAYGMQSNKAATKSKWSNKVDNKAMLQDKASYQTYAMDVSDKAVSQDKATQQAYAMSNKAASQDKASINTQSNLKYLDAMLQDLSQSRSKQMTINNNDINYDDTTIGDYSDYSELSKDYARKSSSKTRKRKDEYR